MSRWTTHTKYTFHAENNTGLLSAADLAAVLEARTGSCAMVKDYVGSWKGQTVAGFEIVYIATDADNGQIAFEILNQVIKKITQNNCLMPTREQIEVFCECS